MFFSLSLINNNGLSIDPCEVTETPSQFNSKMLKSMLWVQFLSQQCALSNGSCLTCLWNVRKDQKGMVWTWKSKYIVAFLVTSQLPWKGRIKVTHLILNFSYAVDPQGKTHLQTVRVRTGVKESFSGIYFAFCTCRKFLFTPMCVPWNAKLCSSDAPRVYRHSLPLPEEGELCCFFHLGLSEADGKLEPCLTWQGQYFGHSS